MITSVSNPQVKRVIQLNTKAKARRAASCFVAEGGKLFDETPSALLDAVYVSERFAADPAQGARLQRARQFACEVVSDAVFAKMCDTQTPQGILTVARMPLWPREALLGLEHSPQDAPAAAQQQVGAIARRTAPLLMVLEDLQDPGNLGTIIRTAEGAGVTGIVLSDRTADAFQPKVIRSTMGSIYRVPIRREADLAGGIAWLKRCGVRTCAAHLKGQHSYTREDYTGGTAFLIGNEGRGLTEGLSQAADLWVRIPMEGRVESLNAAVASALFMYEAHRQRAGA